MNAIQTNPAYGIAINRLRKLMKEWNHWYPLRQFDPLRGKNAEQTMAETECLRLSPLLGQIRRDIAEMRRKDTPATCPYTSAEPGTTGENAQPCGQIAEPGSNFCAGHQ